MNPANPAVRGETAPPGLKRNPLDLIEHEHNLQGQLCNVLEAIADGLPSDVDRRLCEQAVTALRYEIPVHHKDEEEGLFVLLQARAESGDNITAVMDRLAQEHATDESFASEILEELDSLAGGQPPRNPDMLGYMLRGFFESYRRHIHWENALVLPLARARLTAADLDELSLLMTRNRDRDLRLVR